MIPDLPDDRPADRPPAVADCLWRLAQQLGNPLAARFQLLDLGPLGDALAEAATSSPQRLTDGLAALPSPGEAAGRAAARELLARLTELTSLQQQAGPPAADGNGRPDPSPPPSVPAPATAQAQAPSTPAADQPIGQSDEWLTLSAVARGLSLYTLRGRKRRPDTTAVSRLGLDENGLSGRARRIRRSSVMEYCAGGGLQWDDRAAAGQEEESGPD